MREDAYGNKEYISPNKERSNAIYSRICIDKTPSKNSSKYTPNRRKNSIKSPVLPPIIIESARGGRNGVTERNLDEKSIINI